MRWRYSDHHRQACFGDCPEYSAKIYADGTVVYLKEFQRFDYWSFKDQYLTDERGMSATDQGSTTTSPCLNGKKKQVKNVYGSKKLDELEDRIDSLAGLYKFLGPL